ncbi:MAG: CPBP family intramembrane metalloprotease [Chloroflexi bacterium]|nr:CPBP family intramembrane metalloprotease [Chloroflexota bacterium]
MSAVIAVTPLNSKQAIEERFFAGRITWARPIVMVFARFVLAILAQSLVAGIFALERRASPWNAAAPWLTVYGTLIDIVCLLLLMAFANREGIRLGDLINFDHRRLGRDLLLGLGYCLLLFPIGLVSGLVFGRLLYGTQPPPGLFGELPTWAAVYSFLIWPVIWGATEQMTYQGYALPRLEVLSRQAWLAVIITAMGWALQHAALPLLVWDWKFMLYRFVTALPLAAMMPIYLRTRRLFPFIVMHWVIDALSVFMGVVAPMIAG